MASHSFLNIFPSCRAKYHFQIPDIQTLQVRFYLDLAVFWKDKAASSLYSNDAQPCIQSENMKSWSKMPKWVFHIRILFNLGPAWFQRGLLTASHIFPVQCAICKANTSMQNVKTQYRKHLLCQQQNQIISCNFLGFFLIGIFSAPRLFSAHCSVSFLCYLKYWMVDTENQIQTSKREVRGNVH